MKIFCDKNVSYLNVASVVVRCVEVTL